ncbi:MAG: histidinol dehydrogenase, partial [Gemmatimonadaceae bacterium]
SGRFSDMGTEERRLLLARSSVRDAGVQNVVASIISRIESDGDTALRELALQYDGIELGAVEVPAERLAKAIGSIRPDLLRAMKRSAANIEAVHRAFLPSPTVIQVEPGVTVGRRPDPLQRVGVYAPGGRAAYPSSVLMGAIPARIAGVGEVILCSPPGPDGMPSPSILAAAQIAKVDRVFAVGGAGAIAAMCLGTSTIPKVDKVVGPGNAFVAEAKLQLASVAAFDSPAGPSELIVIADNSATPAVVAREVIAQAEHDPRAIAIVIAIGQGVGSAIEAAVAEAALRADRNEIVLESLRVRGGVVIVDSVDEAISLANDFAPEHLMIATEHPEQVLTATRNAGTVFLGETSSVTFGDYLTGANHVLPTGGLARCYSGLSTLDFIRWTTYQSIDTQGAAALSADVAEFARAEGLFAHAAAAHGLAENRNENSCG